MCRLLAWLADDHLLFTDFGPYGIFMNVCVLTVVTVMLVRDFGPYGIFMNVCVLTVVTVMLFRDFGPYGL
jgi:predicted membrane metal-binding protein